MKKTMLVVSACLALILGALPWVLTGCGGSDDTTTPTPMTTNSTPAPVEKTMTGVWHGSFSTGPTFVMDLTQHEDMLTGSYFYEGSGAAGSVTGQITSNNIQVTTVRDPGHIVSQWQGTVNEDRTASSGIWTNVEGASSSGTYSMNK